MYPLESVHLEILELYRVRCVLKFFRLNVKKYAVYMYGAQSILLDISRNSDSKFSSTWTVELPKLLPTLERFLKFWGKPTVITYSFGIITITWRRKQIACAFIKLTLWYKIPGSSTMGSISEMILDLQERSLVNCLHQMFKVYWNDARHLCYIIPNSAFSTSEYKAA